MKARRPADREDHVRPLVIAGEIGLLIWVLFFVFVVLPLIS